MRRKRRRIMVRYDWLELKKYRFGRRFVYEQENETGSEMPEYAAGACDCNRVDRI